MTTHKAGNRRAFPLRLGDLRHLVPLQGMSLADATAADFVHRCAKDSWTLACIHACNTMFGYNGPLREGGGRKPNAGL